MTIRGNKEGRNLARLELEGGRRPNTGRIDPMGLRKVPDTAIILGERTFPTLNGEPLRLQSAEQFPACCIHRARILEWCFRLGHDLVQELWFPFEEGADVLCPLGSIALLTSQTEVGNPVGPALCPWDDVLDLQGESLLLAAGTGTSPLLEQVLSDLIALQFALLILHA